MTADHAPQPTTREDTMTAAAPYDAGDAAPAIPWTVRTYTPADALTRAEQRAAEIQQRADSLAQVARDTADEIAAVEAALTRAGHVDSAASLAEQVDRLAAERDQAVAARDLLRQQLASAEAGLRAHTTPTQQIRAAAAPHRPEFAAYLAASAAVDATPPFPGSASARAQGIRPTAWQQQATDAAKDALVEHWGYEVTDPTPAQMAADAVRAIIDAGLAGPGGRCRKCGQDFPRTLPASQDPLCWTCDSEEQTDVEPADRAQDEDAVTLARAIEQADSAIIDRDDSVWRVHDDGLWRTRYLDPMTRDEIEAQFGPTRTVLLVDIERDDEQGTAQPAQSAAQPPARHGGGDGQDDTPEAHKVAEAVEPDAWIVPKIAHDQNRLVGPRVHGRWIYRAAGQSDPDHARRYAAELLAAADAAEQAEG